jgi:3'(2'), 5'-bisphosphate nucleotidase
MSSDIIKVCQIAKDAGDKIIDIYNDPTFSSVVDFKADNSPLTLADKASHNVITSALKEHFPEIPVLSEEDDNIISYEERSSWQKYWLIDPLDGTKEFIKRNGEFTVNIALIENKRVVLGIIYVPVTGVFYFGTADGAFKKEGSEVSRKIEINNREKDRIAVRSKSHASPQEDDVFKEYDVVNFISVGSSLKFCMVAEGKADLYYRHGPTMEWDTAAGQAILEAAGGRMYRGNKQEEPFTYNKKDLLNGSFLCIGF